MGDCERAGVALAVLRGGAYTGAAGAAGFE
jgi:hypothetical protein